MQEPNLQWSNNVIADIITDIMHVIAEKAQVYLVNCGCIWSKCICFKALYCASQAHWHDVLSPKLNRGIVNAISSTCVFPAVRGQKCLLWLFKWRIWIFRLYAAFIVLEQICFHAFVTPAQYCGSFSVPNGFHCRKLKINKK